MVNGLQVNIEKGICTSSGTDKALVFWQLDENSNFKDNYKMKEKHYS